MRDDRRMRTTLDIDDDVLQAAKEIAARKRTTAGKVLSSLVRSALAPTETHTVRNGVPILRSPALARALYRECDIDKPVPELMYARLAPVYRWLFSRKRGAVAV